MTPNERAIRQRLKDDFEHYALKCLKIRDKAGSISPLILNRAQQYLHQEIEKQRERVGFVRVVGLKGRQQGFSTYTEARFYWKTTHRRGVSAYILTHEQNATDTLFGMAKRYHEHCPEVVRPCTAAANAKELRFDRLDSGYEVGTAGSKATGRSKTLQYFHGSEVAHWPNAEEHLAGVMQAVPRLPGTEIILESTANGAGGVFHRYWQDAKAGNGDYVPIFVPWFWESSYQADATGMTRTSEESLLSRVYGLTNEQLAWRRLKISELKSEALFHQEYPCTDEEAFIFSGRKVFEAAHLLTAKLETYSPKYNADITNAGINQRADGLLRVWDDPKPGTKYVIGADVAEGLAHGDYSCVDVLRLPDGAQVAQWHGHIDPDRFADVLANLGNRYNRAMVGVERNNHGLTTLTLLRNRGYPNLYVQERLEHRSDDMQSSSMGWLTTSKSKSKIIDQLAAELRDGNHLIACKETIDEMSTYIINPNGSYGASPGCFDDRVMSRAIAGEMVLASPRMRTGVVVQSYAPADPVGGY